MHQRCTDITAWAKDYEPLANNPPPHEIAAFMDRGRDSALSCAANTGQWQNKTFPP